MKRPVCPTCGETFTAIEREASPWKVVFKSGLFDGSKPARRIIPNPDRAGWVIHEGDRKCPVIDIDKLIAQAQLFDEVSQLDDAEPN